MSPLIRRQVQLFGVSGSVILILLALLCLTFTYQDTLIAAPTQTHRTTLAQTGSITGQVTAEDSGMPLTGIEVVAFPRGVAEGEPSVTVFTDPAGRYELPGLLASTYKVCFAPFRTDERYLSECYDNRPLEAEPEQLVAVTVGETLPNINAVLEVGGVLQGRVTSERTGEPLPNIHVLAYRQAVYYNRGALTDYNGFYTVTALPTDNYQVSFNAGSSVESYATEYYEDKATWETSDPISVTAGITTSGIDAALTFILNITGHYEYEPTYQREYDAALEISVYDAAGDKVHDHLAASHDYTITGLAPGAYHIRFGRNEFVNEYYPNSPTFEEAAWITVTENVVVNNDSVTLIARKGSDLTLATAATRPDVILATRSGTFSPLYTLDGGQTWHTFATKPVDFFHDVRAIAVAPKDDAEQPVRFVVAPSESSVESRGIYRSADEGASWASFVPAQDPRCDPNLISTVEDLAASATDPQRLYALTRCTKTFSGLEPIYDYYWTLYASRDGGVNWAPETLPLVFDQEPRFVYREDHLLPSPVEPTRIYAKFEIGFRVPLWRRSDNGGQSWTTDSFTATALALDWTDASKLYIVEDQKQDFEETNVFRYTGKRSSNTGASWEDWPQQPCRTSFLQLLSLPTADTLLMLCNQGLYRSNDGGDSWLLLTNSTGGELSVHYGDRDLVLWVRGAELYGSRDQGMTWQEFGGWHDTYLPSAHQP